MWLGQSIIQYSVAPVLGTLQKIMRVLLMLPRDKRSVLLKGNRVESIPEHLAQKQRQRKEAAMEGVLEDQSNRECLPKNEKIDRKECFVLNACLVTGAREQPENHSMVICPGCTGS